MKTRLIAALVIGLTLTIGGTAVCAPRFASGADYAAMRKANLAVKPAVPAYKVKSGLSNVRNLALFKKSIEPKMAEMIAKNGFVVTPTNYTQMYFVYENNEYQPGKFPAFITTDSMLHTYHVFYDYSLRVVESTKLFDTAVSLTNAMLQASAKAYDSTSDPFLKDAARRNVAFFAVAKQLLDGTPPPQSVKDLAGPDLELIGKHEARTVSHTLGFKLDFSQFVPRGHYTRSEKLKKYFKAMMWYGLSPFPVPQKQIGPTATMQAILITRDLRDGALRGKSLLALWDTIYEPTAFYVGTADDYTADQYAKIVERVYGKSPSLAELADKAKLESFVNEVKKLPAPGIDNTGPDTAESFDPLVPTGRQFRFMGQRFIPDSRVMQEMVDPKVTMRGYPTGLDVLSGLGSDRALNILRNSYKANQYARFESQMAKMRKELAQTPLETWQSNLYWGWLWSLQSVVTPAGVGYPSFMRNSAWNDKSLLTALGSWTELRHDTILYAKQSGTECGGEEEPAYPRGYVEPNLEFWTRLGWLNSATRDGLVSRGLLDEELRDKFEKLGDWLSFCRRITIKELTNQKVTEEEYIQMRIYGAELEELTIYIAGGDVMSDTDKDMALVADVHTNFNQGKVLEEGTGRAAAIWVVVPIQGKLYLTRGAIYTQYEFLHPLSDRLTDEKWQKLLKSGKEPKQADWQKSFFIGVKKKPAGEFENYTGGC